MKVNKTIIAGYLLLGGALVFGVYGVAKSAASGSYQNLSHASQDQFDDSFSRVSSTTPNSMYLEECGSCHIAYPAKLLPVKSWQKIMLGLEDHFGENAELDSQSSQTIENYLVQSSSSTSYSKMLRNLGDKSPLRITQLPYFIHEHDEIPSKFIEGNDEIGSLSQCNACHRSAEKGDFDEDNIIIPGVGRWHD